MNLPAASRPFVEFPAILRAHGFAVAPDQTVGFIQAIQLLGPRDMVDIRRAAIAMLAIPRDREGEFDALFRAHFLGQTVAAPAAGDDDEVIAYEPDGGTSEAEEGEELSETGQEATPVERLALRELRADGADEALRRFGRLAPSRLPRRRSYRLAPARRRGVLDLRRTLREASRHDGEAVSLLTRRRKTRQRRVVVLIDVSGSMKKGTEDRLHFAHAMVTAADFVEVFTLGTRLTRVTAELRVRDRTQALLRVGRLVSDFDGGTRIGEALRAFLSIPRYAGFARGAVVLVLSDGLERGGPEAMVEATHRLSRLAWRLDWLSPLAGEDGYRPETSALAAILSDIDTLGDGSRLRAICEHVLTLGAGR